MPCICSGPREKRLPFWQIVNPVSDVASKSEVECSVCERTWRSSAAYVDTIKKGTEPTPEELAYNEGFEDGADDYGCGINRNPYREERLGK